MLRFLGTVLSAVGCTWSAFGMIVAWKPFTSYALMLTMLLAVCACLSWTSLLRGKFEVNL